MITLISGAVLSASGVVFMFLAHYEYSELFSEVNEKLPEGQKFEPLFWSMFTRREFRRLQRAVLPESSRPKRESRFRVIGLVLFFIGVALVLRSL